jgi:hypothetical protein
MEDKRIRDYALNELPTLEWSGKNDELLKQVYTEVNSNYRNLADIRFKLLSFVPAVSVLAWVELINKLVAKDLQNAVFGLMVSILAIRIIFGIRIYDKRNDELYNDLVSRGRKIEDELGIGTAIFKGRLKPNKKDKIFQGEINHGRGLDLIYSSVFAGWGLIGSWYGYKVIIFLIAKCMV